MEDKTENKVRSTDSKDAGWIELQLRELWQCTTGIEACAEILRQDAENDGCLPSMPCAYTVLDQRLRAGLADAIAVCSQVSAATLEKWFDRQALQTYEEWRPDVAEEIAALDRGELPTLRQTPNVRGES
ncbi:MAG: hypothetical protein AAF265_05670 [Pseudomonadota bacterium]